MKRMLSRRDIVLLATLFLCSFVPLAIFGWGGSPVMTAVITVDGATVREIPLTTHEGRETFTVETPGGTTASTVDGNAIAGTNADCHDKICVKSGAIAKKGDAIACLPHKLVIEIR